MSRERWLSAGLFLTTFATLLVEILDSRLLSVLTWYHLSFFAVSLAMLGMAAGAVIVFLGGRRFLGEAAVEALTRRSLWFALSVPVSHVVTLVIPLPSVGRAPLMGIAALTTSIVALAVPFVLSGTIVTLALTRVGGRIGRLYGWDLVGAALGALLVVPLLDRLNLSSVMFVAGAAAGAAAWCFSRFASAAVPAWPGGARHARAALVVTAALVVAAGLNGDGPWGIGVRFSKDRVLPWPGTAEMTRWTSYSFVVLGRPGPAPPVYWGAGALAATEPLNLAWMVIDGEAATALTEWPGDRRALEWVRHDVTSLAHHLRRGRAAVIGVGGGRDILSALWAGHSRVVGIEVNRVLIDILERSHRQFAGLADDPAVELVYDEARSYLRRSRERFDVLQMSLIDTWAATGAGAFTLTENGLYTREAWQVFIDSLAPAGIFSVSRWFSPSNISETNRLMALGVAALVDRGIAAPRQCLVLLARGPVATLLLSPQPFSDADRTTIESVARAEGFDLLVSPWHRGASRPLDRIADSGSLAELTVATADPYYDFSPPTDQRPYFFNILKPSAGALGRLPRDGIAWGNVSATLTLAALCVIASGLVAVIIVGPLVAAGRPGMPARAFALALGYFALIGSGYMLVQIPFLQRFAVFLGHPTYTFAIVLFSMILFTGLGSFLSDRLYVDRGARLVWLPLAIAAMLGATVALLGPVIQAAGGLGLGGRSAVVLAFTAPLSLLLGGCFPIGVRLVGRRSDTAAAWLWGVNGACGVMASVFAVAISMWIGIDANLLIAAGLYLLLAWPLRALAV